jgi:membrane associated rhomboid family serine protease
MTDFKRFEDDSDVERKGDDLTTTKFHFPNNQIDDDAEEFRNEKLDYNFRRNPIKTWLKMMFPHFTLVSLTTGYMLILSVFYLIEFLIYLNGNYWSCITYTFGSNYTPAIQRGHVQRLVFPAFLHNDLPHLLWNLFVLAAVGMNAEHYLGTIGYGALMAAAIVVGNTFTAAFRSKICHQSIGAGTSIMGVIAFEFLWFLFNWNKMGLSKWLYSLYFGTIFMTSLMGTWVAGYIVEFWGHLGAFIAGICIA